MKLFIWQGDNVLADYTSGMIVALAPDLEGALKAIEANYRSYMGLFPALPSEVVDLGASDATPRAWAVHGGG